MESELTNDQSSPEQNPDERSRKSRSSGSGSGRSGSSRSGSSRSSSSSNSNTTSGPRMATSSGLRSKSSSGKSSSSGKKFKSSSSGTLSIKAKVFNIALFLLRVTVSVCMLTHGMKKFDLLLSGQSANFQDPIGLGPSQTLLLAVIAEVFCSILIIFGIITRIATIPLMLTLLTAIFAVHAEEGWSKQELPLMYLLNYFVILVMGPGKYSIDRYIKKLRKERFM